MKWFLLAAIGAAIIGFGFISKSRSAGRQIEIRSVPGTYAPVAVLELFTSEGCSSCPPADDLLPQLARLDSNIIPLSFHVDYWNRLGWEDPFSSSEYSERQRLYSRQFKLESEYTPQLVVNGKYELVGSNRNDAETAIKRALQEEAQVQLSVEEVNISKDKLHFIIHATGELKRTDLLAALVQKLATMNVNAGENRGVKLSHINVVRSFAKQTAKQITVFEISFPKNLGDEDWQLVFYTQQKNDLKITGATLYTPSH